MYGYVYETVCILSGRKYIGQHKSDVFDPSYIGSGVLLRKAINKYGKDNFTTVLLESANSRNELNNLEKHYIHINNADKSSDFYNIAPGAGGYNHFENMSIDRKMEVIQKISDSVKLYYRTASKAELDRRAQNISLANQNLTKEQKKHKSRKLSLSTVNQWNSFTDNQKVIREERIRATINSFTDDHKQKITNKKVMSWKTTYQQLSDKVKDSWCEKRAEAQRGTISIIKDGKFKHVKLQDVAQYEAEGWVKGSIATNTIWVNDGTVQKRISPNDLEQYLNNGFVVGQKTGFKWVYNENECLRLPQEQLTKYLDSGYKLGHPGVGRKASKIN